VDHQKISKQTTLVCFRAVFYTDTQVRRAVKPRRQLLIIVAIKRASGDMVFNPVASVSLEENDTLIAMGKSAELEKLVEACQTT